MMIITIIITKELTSIQCLLCAQQYANAFQYDSFNSIITFEANSIIQIF